LLLPLVGVVAWRLVGGPDTHGCTNLVMRGGDRTPSFGAAGTCAGLRVGAVVALAAALSAAVGVVTLVTVRARHVWWVIGLTALPLVTLLLVYRAYL
jgi:hypothetical protein